MYALLGVLLILVRNRSDLTIWILTALSLSFPIMLGIFKMKTVDDAYFLHMERAFSAWLTTNNYAYGSGSFFEAMREHIRETWFLYTDVISLEFTASFYAQLTTTLLLGFLIGRHRIPQRLGELMPSIVRVQYWSLWIGIGSLLALTYGEKHVSPIDLTWKGIAVGMAYVICRLSVMLFYVTTLVRMVQQPRWRTRFEPIASVGRMPLTNYLLQTAIATPIFYGWGLGFWNRGGPLVWLLLALAVFFIVQVPVSVWWLKRFQFGPLEYLWRVLTYGRTMPEHLRRA
jgi:uncharacterized protein